MELVPSREDHGDVLRSCQEEDECVTTTALASAQPPGQLTIATRFSHAERDAEMGVPADVRSRVPCESVDKVELVSGPHLRGVVPVVSLVLWIAIQIFDGHFQFYIVPAVILGTITTSALWCTPKELAISLGPVPTCFFRKHIPYEDIASVAVVRGQLRQVTAVALQAASRPWQPHSYMYGLTLGKDLIDLTLQQKLTDPPKGRHWPSRLLVSVDHGDEVAAHVLFRQQHGPDKPVLIAQPRDTIIGGPVRWVLCDACDILLQPWRTTEPLAFFRDGGRHQRTA